jgi:hypothetical protein
MARVANMSMALFEGLMEYFREVYGLEDPVPMVARLLRGYHRQYLRPRAYRPRLSHEWNSHLFPLESHAHANSDQSLMGEKSLRQCS